MGEINIKATIKSKYLRDKTDLLLNHIEHCDIRGSSGELVFILMYLTHKIKTILKDEVSKEELMYLILLVLNNDLVFESMDKTRAFLEKCYRKEIK